MRDLLLARGLTLCGQRVTTPFAELDLLFLKDRTFYIVEVKTLKSLQYLGVRVGSKQKQRLKRSLLYLTEKYQKQTVLVWAFVLSSGKVMFIREGFID